MTPCNLFFHRLCSDDQLNFHDFSAKAAKISYQATLEKLRELFLSCKSYQAWNIDYVSAYEDCSSEISSSNPKINQGMTDIKTFSIYRDTSIPIQVQLEQITEDIDIRPDLSKGIEIAIEYMKNVSLKSKHLTSSSDTRSCNFGKRHLILKFENLKGFSKGLFIQYLIYQESLHMHTE